MKRPRRLKASSISESKKHDKYKHIPYSLHVHTDISLSPVTEYERGFINDWCRSRRIDESYSTQSLVYWIRVKRHLSVTLMLREKNVDLYMVICIHLALKWQGYEEATDSKCPFYNDLLKIYPDLTKVEHSSMEFELLTFLNWEL